MITGVHTVIYTRYPDEVRTFFRDILSLPFVDAGHDWLIFRAPPAEIAMHPADAPNHEIFLMCDDLQATLADLAGKGVTAGEVSEQRWGLLVSLTIPGTSETISLYEPRHPQAIDLPTPR